MKKIRIGLVGAGAIAREHALSLCRDPRVGGLVVYDPDAARAQALAADFSGSVRRGLGTLVSACDLVWICSPPKAHLAAVQAAARAGRNVFCEKPLAFDPSQAGRIERIADEAGIRVFMGQSGRYTPAFVRMQQLAADGAVGRLLEVWATRLGYLDPVRTPAWRLTDALSGGVALELGVHELDWCQWIGGPWQRLQAQCRDAVLAPGTFTEALSVLGTLAGGIQARVTLDWSSSRYLWQRGIVGTTGCLVYDDSVFNEIRLYRPGRPAETLTAGGADWKDRETGENLSFRDQVAAVLTAFTEQAPPPVSLAAGLGAVAAAHAAMKAARTGRQVMVGA